MSRSIPALLVDRLAWGRGRPGVSFAVTAGERVYVCGEQAGSLLLAVAGFLPTMSGRVVCEGRDLSGMPAPSRHVAYIPGGDSLIGRLSLLGNITLTGARKADAAAVLNRLDLTAVAAHPAMRLTVAQRRLGALARALAASPSLLLVHEAQDDPPAIPDGLIALQRPAALIATVSPHVALARAGRILLLRGAAPVQFAAPRDIYERPADAFAATWSGDCNLIPAELIGEATSDGARIPGAVLARVGQTILAARFRDRATGAVLLAVRPHRTRIEPAGLPVTVRAVEYRGAATRLVVETAQGFALALDGAEHGAAIPGARLNVGWDWSDAWPLAREAT